MPDVNELMLSDIVRISRNYQRSIRIDIDLGRTDALEGYICHGTAMAVLDSMSKQLLESNQRAFTWTGPFGGGKSSLAVALASALSRDHKLRAKARSILPLDSLSTFDKAFPVKQGWLTLPVVGKRASVVSELNKALSHAAGQRKGTRKSATVTTTEIIADICKEAASGEHDGVFIVIDEMGKFLEASALGSGDDIYFFQELAEAAARTSDSITFKGWYAGNSNIVNLQVVASAMSDFAPGSTNILSNNNVEEFNFQTLVSEFDQAQLANPTTNHWAVTNALLSAHLSGSNTAALGGDLAYVYGTQGSLSGFGVAAAANELSSTQFGNATQTLNPWPVLNTGTAQIR